MSVEPIHLDGRNKVGEGGERTVYVHPGDPTRLIKVLKPRPKELFTRWTFGHLTQRYFPATRHRAIAKQYEEYNRLAFTHMSEPDFVMPVSHLYGFVQTNLGPGGMTERVMTEDGGTAPTLETLARGGNLTGDQLDDLNGFIARLYTISVAVSDVNASNFVWGVRSIGSKDTLTPPQWVLIDGFGDRFAIPVRKWFHAARRVGLDDAFKRAPAVAGLRWNRETRSFAFAE